MHYVYILQSQLDQSYYIGYTSNLENRINYHNNGRSRYTRKKMPWKIVYTEKFDSKTEALRKEKFIKKQKSRTFIEELINPSK
ncbi:GIY-YIG nuclease family protein [Marinifilum caeruleilacunae]|uniref:GIY-YIG nuclease family protein n=1 Tax=Marinifilum caeruleilacunae TaxID=2499076 RepID=A0ABX1WW18_9BACT|nr:GIY-YIG nuclease family protein [Marinifilum caeruleilacunae]